MNHTDFARRAIFIIVLLSMLLPAGRSVASHCSDCPELVFFTWSEYIDPELVREFEQIHDIRIRLRYYETDSERDELMFKADGDVADLVLVDATTMKAYAHRGWVTRVRDSNVPNRRHIHSRWSEAHPDAWKHGVPYAWGTLGIACRVDLVGVVDSWRQLLEPEDRLRGLILMTNDRSDIVAIAMQALGYPNESDKPQHVDEARKLLLAQRPYVKKYGYDTLDATSDLLAGRFAVGTMYSGDAVLLSELDKNIQYFYPKEGALIWTDYIAVSDKSAKKTLAYKFIDFIHQPENAARLARFIHYPTPNEAAEALLPEEFLADPLVYPPEDVLSRSDNFRLPSPRGQRRRNGIMAELLRESNQ